MFLEGWGVCGGYVGVRATYFFNKTRTYRSLGNFKVGNLGEQHMQESLNGEAESTTFINYIGGKTEHGTIQVLLLGCL